MLSERRTPEEVGLELVRLLRRRSNVLEELRRIDKRMGDVEKEALALNLLVMPIVQEERSKTVFPDLRSFSRTGEETYHLTPIADTVTIPAVPSETHSDV